MGVFVYFCVDLSVWICLCVGVDVFVFVYIYEEKENEERRSQFILHGKERKKMRNVKLIK